MIFFFLLGWGLHIRPHCVGCMCALRAYILFLSRPFSRQWSERLPLSFSAASLTSSPVCLKDICYASPLFIHRALTTNTIPTNCPPPQAAQSPRHPYCNSPIERENFHIQIAALTVKHIVKHILIDPWAMMINACWYSRSKDMYYSKQDLLSQGSTSDISPSQLHFLFGYGSQIKCQSAHSHSKKGSQRLFRCPATINKGWQQVAMFI